MRMQRRGVHTTTTIQAPTAASIQSSNAKQPSAVSVARVLQIPKDLTILPPELDGGLDDMLPRFHFRLAGFTFARRSTSKSEPSSLGRLLVH
jgi:hypothetical protein